MLAARSLGAFSMRRWHPYVMAIFVSVLLVEGEPASTYESTCGPRFNFFPPGGEDRNIPAAWGKTAQKAAGNYADDLMYTVMLTGANNMPGANTKGVPVLHVLPVHDLLTAGATGITQGCLGYRFTTEWGAQNAVTALDSQGRSVQAAAADSVPAAGLPAADAPSKGHQDASEANTSLDSSTSSNSVASTTVSKAAAAALSPPDSSFSKGLAVAGTSAALPLSAAAVQVPTTRTEAIPGRQLQSYDNVTLSSNAAEPENAYNSDDSSCSQPGTKDSHCGSHSQQTSTIARHSPNNTSLISFGESTHSLASRQILQADTVVQPAAIQLQYQLNVSAWFDVDEMDPGTPVRRIVLDQLVNYDDGYYCLNLKLIVLAGTGLMSSGLTVPVRDLQTTTQVCFYKLDRQPTAQVDFQSCGSTLSVNISGVEPHPAPLYPGSEQAMFNPIVHFWAVLNRTKEDAWPPEGSIVNFEHWWVLQWGEDAQAPHVYKPDEQLYEGWYNIQMEIGLTTTYPTLIALGVAGADSYTEGSAPESIRDQVKYLGTIQYPNGTVLGYQKGPSQFRSMEGPQDMEIPPNAEMTFNWEFEGFGQQYCWIDGKRFHNSGDMTCRPPLNTVLPDRKNHTLKLVLTDVCGNNVSVEAAYGAWGYAMTKVPKPLNTEGSEMGHSDDQGIFEMAPLQPASGSLTTTARDGRSRSRKVPSNATKHGGGGWKHAVLAVLVPFLVLS